MICDYGCGQVAIKQILSSGKFCCSKSVNSCPAKCLKDSLKKSGKQQNEKTLQKRKNTWKNSEKVEIECPCGIFLNIKEGSRKFCSRKCANQFSHHPSAKQDVKSIYDLSKRTMTKIFKRMNLGCSICEWKDGTCDVHHILGRKIPDPHHHSNLTYLCPNHHRLAHEKKLNNFITLDKQIGDSWRQFYFSE
jgi:hypothetical protein